MGSIIEAFVRKAGLNLYRYENLFAMGSIRKVFVRKLILISYGYE